MADSCHRHSNVQIFSENVKENKNKFLLTCSWRTFFADSRVTEYFMRILFPLIKKKKNAKNKI